LQAEQQEQAARQERGRRIGPGARTLPTRTPCCGPERLAGAGGVAVRVTDAAPRRILGPWIGPLTRAR